MVKRIFSLLQEHCKASSTPFLDWRTSHWFVPTFLASVADLSKDVGVNLKSSTRDSIQHLVINATGLKFQLPIFLTGRLAPCFGLEKISQMIGFMHSLTRLGANLFYATVQ